MSADLDFITLWEDYDTVVALESRGAGLENPMIRSIAKRWCVLDAIEQEVIEEETVARESREMMHRAQVVSDGEADGSIAKKVTKDAAKLAGKAALGAGKIAGKTAFKGGAHAARLTQVAGKGAGKVSLALGHKFKEWASHYGSILKEKLAEMTNKATTMENRRLKLVKKLDGANAISDKPFRAALWASQVCFEDKPDFNACIKLANSFAALDAVVKEYTVSVFQTDGFIIGRYKEEEGVFKKIGYPSNAAIHRASGLLGRFTEADVQARPLAGNVIVVNYGRQPRIKVDFGVAREAKIGGTMEPLNKAQCEKALAAVEKIAKTLKDRGVKRGAFSYSGIYEEMEKMKAGLDSLEGDELRTATLLYKNSFKLEDAFTTALARVGDGLLSWVQSSLAGKD